MHCNYWETHNEIIMGQGKSRKSKSVELSKIRREECQTTDTSTQKLHKVTWLARDKVCKLTSNLLVNVNRDVFRGVVIEQ